MVITSFACALFRELWHLLLNDKEIVCSEQERAQTWNDHVVHAQYTT